MLIINSLFPIPDKRTFFDKTFAAAAALKGSKNLFFGKNFCVLSTYFLYNYIICRARENERKFLQAKRHKQSLTVRFVVFFQLTLTLQPHIFVFYQDKAFLLNGSIPSSRILPEFRRGISERRLTDRRSPFPLFCSERRPARSVLPLFFTRSTTAPRPLRAAALFHVICHGAPPAPCSRSFSRDPRRRPARSVLPLFFTRSATAPRSLRTAALFSRDPPRLPPVPCCRSFSRDPPRRPARSVLPLFFTHSAVKRLPAAALFPDSRKKSSVRKTIVLRTGLFLPSFFFTNF